MTDLNIKLEDLHINFIRLVMRSHDLGEGWRSVSKQLRNFAETTVAERPEIYETKVEEGTLMLRLSERGQILAYYI